MNRLVFVIGVLCFLVPLAALADTPIAARVGEDAISVGEVRHELKVVLGERALGEEERKVVEAQTLGLLINRQLVVRFLEQKKMGASENDINQSIDDFKKKLAQQKKTFAEHLQALNLSEPEFRRLLAWELGWPKYVTAKYTDKNLNAYFLNYRRHFDGTKLQVRHILLKVPANADNAAVKTAAEQAVKIREEITSGKISFDEAAKKYSQAATAPQGGDLGLISRHAPMPPSFNDAAYDLKSGETSGPVVTNFGVHLIHCVREEKGSLTLANPEVDKAVREEMVRYLFNLIAEMGRKEKKIVFTGAMPYLKPGSNELVTTGETAETELEPKPVAPAPKTPEAEKKSEKK